MNKQSLIQRILQNGIHGGVPPEDVKHIQILNLMAIMLDIYVAANLALTIPYFNASTIPLAILHSLFLVTMTAAFLCNTYGQFMAARIVFVATVITEITGVSMLMGRDTLFHVYALSGFFTSFYLFPARNQIHAGVLSATFFCSYLFLELFWFPHHPTSNLPTGFLRLAGPFTIFGGLPGVLFLKALITRIIFNQYDIKLRTVNQELEKRVQEQVGEIVQRSEEVSTLNTQLQIKVQERSRELAQALGKLARQIHGSIDVGDVLADRVKIIRELGRGGMGRVYLADDLLTNRKVAVKLLLPEMVGDSDDIQRFIKEAAAAATVYHPAIVRTVSIDVTEQGHIFHIMDYVPGHMLSKRLGRGPLNPGHAARIGAIVASALAAAHEQRVIHRDVKSSNIMLSLRSPGVFFMDFGLAKKIAIENEEEIADLDVTIAGAIVGTPHYMSPEQIRDSSGVTTATDIYSMGIVLFEMLSGRTPFQTIDFAKLCLAHLEESPPDLRTLVRGVPDELRDLIERCLSKQLDLRPTAQEVSLQLTAIADALHAPDVAACAAIELKILPSSSLTAQPPSVDTRAQSVG